MARYSIDGATLDGLADAIRSVTGATVKYTPTEMIEEVRNILNAATFVLVDADGNEYTAAYLDSDYICTAKEDDIRIGTTAITANGFVTGTKEIPNYIAEKGHVIVPPGQPVNIPVSASMCDYTLLQALICDYNTSVNDSVVTDKIVINNTVYSARSNIALSNVDVDVEQHLIKLGLTNDKETPIVVRYVLIKDGV